MQLTLGLIGIVLIFYGLYLTVFHISNFDTEDIIKKLAYYAYKQGRTYMNTDDRRIIARNLQHSSWSEVENPMEISAKFRDYIEYYRELNE